MDIFFINTIFSVSRYSHSIIIKLSRMTDDARSLSIVPMLAIAPKRTIWSKFDSALNSFILMTRPCIAIIDSHTFAITSKILPTMLLKRTTVISLPSELVKRRMSMTNTIASTNSTMINLRSTIT
jgi:hypothetical protein